jgi:hypothetical protein
MADDEGLEDWNPDKEKKEDPAKLQREAIELQRESIEVLRSFRDRNVEAPVLRVYKPPPMPKQITVQIREIDNGFILAKTREMYPGHDGTPQEAYYPTIPQLLEGLEKAVEGAFLALDPTPEAQKASPGTGGTTGTPYPPVDGA